MNAPVTQEILMHAVRTLREHMQLGQMEFAMRVGVSLSSIYRHENTQRPVDLKTIVSRAELASSKGRNDLCEVFMHAAVALLPGSLL